MHPELSRRTFVLFEMSPHAALVHSASLTRLRFHLKTESVERMSGATSTPWARSPACFRLPLEIVTRFRASKRTVVRPLECIVDFLARLQKGGRHGGLAQVGV